MSQPAQPASSVLENERATASSLTMASGSITSGMPGRDVERGDDVVDSKERDTADGPPEGGLEAWSVVLGAWCCSFCCYGWINSEWFSWSSAT